MEIRWKDYSTTGRKVVNVQRTAAGGWKQDRYVWMFRHVIHSIDRGRSPSRSTSKGAVNTSSFADDVEGAVDYVMQAEVSILFVLPLRIGVRLQEQRLILRGNATNVGVVTGIGYKKSASRIG